MIIEGAFLKIPEILLNYDNKDDLYEANIVSLLTNAIILELNARNIDNPLMKLQLEKRYNSEKNIRCDLYTYFDFIKDNKLNEYGYFNENWIEVKYFGDLDRAKGNQTKTENAANIMYDLYRLAKNSDANISKGLYSLNIFGHNISKYLAFNRKDKSERIWLRTLLKSGVNKFSFNLDEEPPTQQNVFGGVNKVEFSGKIRTLLFEPLCTENNQFSGYLIQILSFHLADEHEIREWSIS